MDASVLEAILSRVTQQQQQHQEQLATFFIERQKEQRAESAANLQQIVEKLTKDGGHGKKYKETLTSKRAFSRLPQHPGKPEEYDTW